ncbi:MAG: radical SAM family heme chaperone HemW [Rhodospirillales bacterium]|jgi:oxygen-independent coproporphyrinogen-3 oxidase|nr:radical SAM family heme chaperone HemW [Rhodospirillales bacterium]
MDNALSLYVHWPFCRSKCPYCDFNSYAGETIEQERWRSSLLREIEYFANETNGRVLASVFFGGGTPSLMAPETVAAVIAAARRHWPTIDDLEITLEANPTSSEADHFAALAAAGVTRLSLGVQSFDDAALAFLGRAHDAAEAKRAIGLAAAAFERYSFDLIYARPGQTAADWRRELAEALSFAPGHLSVYQLTIEPGTAFHQRGVVAADEDVAAVLYETTHEVLETAGLPAYEISNHARPGAECRHNLAIWRGGDYVGVGPGAHGRLSGAGRAEALRQIHTPARWLAAVDRQGHGTAQRVRLDARQRAEELIMLGLRTAEGVNRTRFAAQSGIALDDAVDAAAAAELVDGGFLEADGETLRATAAGRQRLNAVLSRLLA